MQNLLLACLMLSFYHLGMGQGLHSRAQNLSCLEKDFPVIVHLSVDSTNNQPYLSDADVSNLLTKVSEFFEPICMSFSPCEINPIDNYTFHNIVDDRRFREMRILYGKPRRINIFILGTIPDAQCGSSTFYGVDRENGEYIYLETNGCNDSLEGQLAHHLGHYFGLSDTYRGNDLEVVNELNCAVVSDSICDTPTDPYGRYQGAVGNYLDPLGTEIDMTQFLDDCEFIHELKDPNDEYYQPQVGNIMSAYPCRCGFTNGQFQKIIHNYNSATHKPY